MHVRLLLRDWTVVPGIMLRRLWETVEITELDCRAAWLTTIFWFLKNIEKHIRMVTSPSSAQYRQVFCQNVSHDVLSF